MILQAVVAAVCLGLVAQIVAGRTKIPAILPLLVLGIAAGPGVLGLFDPAALGDGLEVFIHLGIAIILFEGGLSLDPAQLRKVGAAVRNLLTLGVATTGLAAAWLAKTVVGMPWPTAALFGAIMTVTGPTVIVPLLRHMIAPRRVKTILISEGLIVDPIGAVLAYLVLQGIEHAGVPLEEFSKEVLTLAAVGAILGFVAGSLGNFLARSRLVGAELRNLTILATVLLCFLSSEKVAHQSGILAVVVMGFTMSVAKIPDLEPIKAFKEQLTTLLISTLFVLLAAQLDLGAILDLGWKGLVVAAGLIFLVRPLSIFLSVMPSQADLKERTVLALTAPRGIVAAAVASLAARELSLAGLPGGPQLEGLVYLGILVTGTWATVMAVALPRWLGYLDDPSRRLTVLVGASPLSRELALFLDAEGRTTVVIDSARPKLEGIRRAGLTTVRGDAREAEAYEKAGVERDTQLLALTANDELNLLAAELVNKEFGVEHPVVALANPSGEFGIQRRVWMVQLGAEAIDVGRWSRRLDSDRARLITVALEDESDARAVADLQDHHPGEAVYVCGWRGDHPTFRPRPEGLETLNRATFLATTGEVSEALEAIGRPAEPEAEAPQDIGGGEATPAGEAPKTAPDQSNS